MTNQQTVLIISYYFPPMGLSGVVKTAKTAKYLAKHGWRVIVLTATPKHYYAYDATLLEELIDAGVHIYSTPSKNQAKPGETSPLPGFIENSIIKPLQYQLYFPDPAIRWKKMAISAAEGIIHQYNVSLLISVSPPLSNHVITDIIAERFQIPFILDYQDLWTRGVTVDSTKTLKSSAHQKLENHLLNRTARILVPSRIAKEQMIKEYRFLEHDDILIMPPGFDPDDLEHVPNSQSQQHKCIIMHTGLADEQGGLHEFLKAFKEFISVSPEAQKDMVISLPGLISSKTSAYIDKLGLRNNIEEPGYCSHKDLFTLMADASVLLATTKSTSRIPTKMYEYIATGKPLCVIAPNQSAAQIFARESGSAFCAEPHQKTEIDAMLRNLYSSWRTRTFPKQQSGFAQHFDLSNLIEDLSIACTKAIRL